MRLLLSSFIMVVAVAFSISAAAKDKGKPRGHVKGAKPAKIEKKIEKKAKKGKHDLGAALDAHKGKGKGKGKAKGKIEATKKSEEATNVAAKESEEATNVATAPGKGKGHAWGKNKKFHELSKHLKRLAKLKRLEEIATTAKNEALLAKVKMLVDKEQKRHERVVARVETKETIKDAKAAAKKAD
jgi:hypothetical protein